MGLGAGAAAAISIATSVIGGVVSAIGAEQQAAAQGKAAEYTAEVAANNATIAQQKAQVAAASGSEAVEQQGMKTKAAVGAIEAAQAASNIDVNQGSAVDVRSSAAATGELNALTTRANAEQQVYGYQTQQASYLGQESLAQMQASQASTAGIIGATTSLLSGASQAGSQYSQWLRVGGGGSGGGLLSSPM